jgi:hypothetical protein
MGGPRAGHGRATGGPRAGHGGAESGRLGFAANVTLGVGARPSATFAALVAANATLAVPAGSSVTLTATPATRAAATSDGEAKTAQRTGSRNGSLADRPAGSLTNAPSGTGTGPSSSASSVSAIQACSRRSR